MPPDQQNAGPRRPRLVLVRVKFKPRNTPGRRWPVVSVEHIEVQDASVDDVTDSGELVSPPSSPTIGEDGAIESTYYDEYIEDEEPKADPVIVKGDKSTQPSLIAYQRAAFVVWLIVVLGVLACFALSAVRGDGENTNTYLAALVVLVGGGGVAAWVFRS